MAEETVILYGVLSRIGKDGLIKIGRQECFEVNFKKGLYWPAKAGYGECYIGKLKPTIKEALEQETSSLMEELKKLKRAERAIEKRLEAVQTARNDSTKMVVSKSLSSYVE